MGKPRALMGLGNLPFDKRRPRIAGRNAIDRDFMCRDFEGDLFVKPATPCLAVT